MLANWDRALHEQQSDVAFEYVGQNDPVHGPTDLAVVTARLPALLGRVHWQDHLSHTDMHGAFVACRSDVSRCHVQAESDPVKHVSTLCTPMNEVFPRRSTVSVST
jgi:hypothetical protein